MTPITCFLLALGLLSVQSASIQGREKRSPRCKVDSWEAFNNHEYGALFKARTFTKAQDICAACGGIVVTIHSADESDFIASRVNPDGESFWLGYTRNSWGQFEWEDYQDSNYSRWRQSEESGIDCAFVNKHSAWKYIDCDNSRKIICKRTTANNGSTSTNSTGSSNYRTDYSEAYTTPEFATLVYPPATAAAPAWVKEVVRDMAKWFKEWIEDFQKSKSWLRVFLGDIKKTKNWVEEMVEDLQKSETNWWKKMVQGFQKVENWWEEVVENFQKSESNWWEEMVEDFGKSKNWLEEMVEDFKKSEKNWWEELVEDFVKFEKNWWEELIEDYEKSK